jgi:cell division protein FtsQ
MWDNHQMLGSLANSLFAFAALIASYYITKWAINLPLLPLKEISVSSVGTGALKHVTHERIRESVRTQSIGNFLTVDLDAVRGAFGKLPWVRTASVRRIWPDTLELKIEEHVALARWGNRRLLNIQGEIFEATSDRPLPLFEGMDESAGDMARHYAIFSELLRPLEENIDYIRLSPRQAWTLRLGNGTTLELGREQLEARLKRYVAAHSHGFGKVAVQPGNVDLRYPNGFAVR